MSSDQKQEPSIRRLLKGPNHIDNQYCAYLCTLGQLDLKHALSLEWKLFLASADLSDTATARNDAMLPFHVFAMAFSLAGDSEKALAILKKGPNVNPEPSLGDKISTPDTRSWHYVRKLADLIVSHYKCLNLQATKPLFDQINPDFRNLSDDPEAALIVLERYLLPDYQRGTQLRLLEVKEFLDQQVLLVVPVNGGRPLHAKVLKRSDGSSVGEDSKSLLNDVENLVASGGADCVA
jgi:hypothetical protein